MLPTAVFILAGIALGFTLAYNIVKIKKRYESEFLAVVAFVACICTAGLTFAWAAISTHSAGDRADCRRTADEHGVETVFKQYGRTNWECFIVMPDGRLVPSDRIALVEDDR